MTIVAAACTTAMICDPANAADPKVTIFSGIDEHGSRSRSRKRRVFLRLKAWMPR